MEFTERQEEIIEHALRLIAAHGIEKLTYRNLAIDLGITEPAFYRHFGNKTEILMAILKHFDGLRRQLFRDIRTQITDNLKAIEAIFTKHLGLFQINPALVTLLFPEEIRQGRKELEAKVQEMMNFGFQQITAMVDEGIKSAQIRQDIDPQQLALMISGSLRLIVKRWRLNGYPDDLENQGARFWKTLSAMIREPKVPAGDRSKTRSKSNANPAGDSSGR